MSRIGCLLFSLLFAAGCGRIGLEIDTVVHEDGSLERTVTYCAELSDREALFKEYRLPAGLSWEITEKNQMGEGDSRSLFRERLLTYKAHGTFRNLETDYAKQDGRIPPSWSTNRISIQATPEFYLYEEAFSDTTDVPQLRRLGERYVQELVERAIAECKKTLFREEPAPVIESIRSHVTTSSLGYFNQIWHGLERVESKEGLETVQTLIGQGSEFLISQIDQWWNAEGLRYPEHDARRQVVRTLTEASERESEEDESWLDSHREDLIRYGGAYLPFWMDRSYHFKATVAMPAEIVESNAAHVKGNVAIWEFDPMLFLLKDYTLRAKAKRPAKGEDSK